MKNVSPQKEKHENMPSVCASSGRREVKSVFQQTNQGQTERNLEARTIPKVVSFNSDFTTNLKILRTRAMGHPGHYFQKALNIVTQKSRSQSLPSCLESKKSLCAPRDDHNKDMDQKQEDDIKEVDIVSLKVNSIISNETWFRTWPERGNDKIISPHNNNSGDCHTNVLNENENSLGSAEKELGIIKYNHNFQSRPTGKLTDTQSSYSLSLDKPYNDAYDTEINPRPNIAVQCPSLCKSDIGLSSNCDTRNCSSNIGLLEKKSSSLKPEYSIDSISKAPIPLSDLLQNIPLAYSPVTKQLHIISPTHLDLGLQEQTQNSVVDLKKEVHQNGLKQPLESIEEEGLADRVTVQCENDSLSFESPRSTLQRFGTSLLLRTNASSFSSIVSSLSDVSPSSGNDDLDDLPAAVGLHINPADTGDCCFDEVGGTKTKRKGITGFFSRNVFVWKSSRDTQNNSNNNTGTAPGWKLFGRLTSKPSEQDVTPNTETSQLPESPASVRSTGSGNKRYEDVVASSSALILHNRPSNLPAKSQDEDQKHRQEYQQMVEAARKKELKEAKLRKKQLQRQLKIEEQLANAARIWNNEILPKWDMMKTSRKARDLWWRGIPPSVRGKVWKLAIGNDLNVTHQLYNICLARAQERLRAVIALEDGEAAAVQIIDNVDKEASMELIQLDIARTFPHLCIFQRGGPYYDMLHCLLGAYVCYRPDVGYVQGMSFIAAVLILNLEAADAFICFANLLNRPCHMAFFCLNQTLMNAYYAAYNDFFRENLPRLYTHFIESSLSADLYLLDWLYTVFAKAMPLDVACRVWDVFLRDGEEFLFKAALGVLHLNQEVLLKLDFIHGAQFLTKLPDDLAADQLFRSIEAIHMNVGKQRFGEVLAQHIDKCQEDPS